MSTHGDEAMNLDKSKRLLSVHEVHGVLLKMAGWPDREVSTEHRNEINNVCSDYLVLSEKLRETERRVRWLERFVIASAWVGHGDGTACRYCASEVWKAHYESCAFFLPDGTPKPTPRNFE